MESHGFVICRFENIQTVNYLPIHRNLKDAVETAHKLYDDTYDNWVIRRTDTGEIVARRNEKEKKMNELFYSVYASGSNFDKTGTFSELQEAENFATQQFKETRCNWVIRRSDDNTIVSRRKGAIPKLEDLPEFQPEAVKQVAEKVTNELPDAFLYRDGEFLYKKPVEVDEETCNEWMKPKSIMLLEEAAKIQAERGKQYDKDDESSCGQERSMERTVQLFNTLCGKDIAKQELSYPKEMYLRESQGWLFMILLKLVRSESKKEPHEDSIKDLISYASLYGEARLEGK